MSTEQNREDYTWYHVVNTYKGECQRASEFGQLVMSQKRVKRWRPARHQYHKYPWTSLANRGAREVWWWNSTSKSRNSSHYSATKLSHRLTNMTLWWAFKHSMIRLIILSTSSPQNMKLYNDSTQLKWYGSSPIGRYFPPMPNCIEKDGVQNHLQRPQYHRFE